MIKLEKKKTSLLKQRLLITILVRHALSLVHSDKDSLLTPQEMEKKGDPQKDAVDKCVAPGCCVLGVSPDFPGNFSRHLFGGSSWIWFTIHK